MLRTDLGRACRTSGRPAEQELSQGISMRAILISLALVSSAGAALAQTSSIAPAPAAKGVAAPGKAATAGKKSAVAEAKAECMRLWDAGTHMSKREWSATCDRIQSRLDNLKVENLDVMGTGVRKKSGKQGGIPTLDRTNQAG